MIRVGHKGADHVAPGNTADSFRAALEHGVDMIEFDVLRVPDGRLVLAHDYEDAAEREPLTLDEGLDHLAGPEYGHLQLDVDLKLPGYEREVVDGLTRRGLAERSLVSTMYVESLDRLGELSPGLRRGWSVPRVKRDYTRSAARAARLRRDPLDARPAAGASGRAHSRGRVRGDHGPPPARERAPRRGGARGGRRGLRLDRGRRRSDQELRAPWAWTA